MRLAGFRCRFSAVVAVVLATALGVSLTATVLVAGPAPGALATEIAAPLALSVDRSLSRVDEAVTLTIEGEVSQSLKGAKLVVRVKGPAAPSQIGESDAELTEADKIVGVLGEDAATTANTTASVAAGTVSTATTFSTTPTVAVAGTSTAADLAAGVLKATVKLPAGMPAKPGAYLLVVEVKSGTDVWAQGQIWVGKAAPREAPLDIAFVWPVSLGVHRDANGVYYDQVLERAVASESGDLRALLGLSNRFTEWDFTVAVEPVLLTQLRDMADGYVRLDGAGNEVDVGEDDPEAQNAAAVLDAFKGLVGDGSVEIAAGPYSGADLSVLAAEGWRDGFEQIQMGKQELQQSLGLGAPLTGACSPDLGLTTDSLAYYAEASIDHVVVESALAGLEMPRTTGSL
jgi:hypothetical protein